MKKSEYLVKTWTARLEDMVGKYTITFDAPEKDTLPNGKRPMKFLQNDEYSNKKRNIQTGFPWMSKCFANQYQAKYVASRFPYNSPKVLAITRDMVEEWKTWINE